ncbi:MAG: TonB C-terminal domain-containing protein [Deltaproteobacteria bacterium]|nr:TonB C-terminal domain-containing protein [Deltaproteobacteria bacterium]
MAKRIRIFFSLFWLASLTIHLSILLGLDRFSFSNEPAQNPPDSKVVWVETKNLSLVDLPKPQKEERPKVAKFKSTYNSKVNQETVAAQKNPHATLTDHSQGKVTQQSSRPTQNTPKIAPFPNSKSKVYEPPVNGESFNETAWDRFNHDFMPMIKVGEKTWVNAYGMPDAQYFTMLKRIFRLRFNPAPPLRAYFRGHPIDVRRVRVTMVVTLDERGRLKKLAVLSPSGITNYDNESLRTVLQSSPFTSPPKSLLYQGDLEMKWTFITYIL